MTVASTNALQLSLVIPVYNRPNEVDELLSSLCQQTNPDFEVIIVDDGSSIKCEEQVEQYKSRLNISYFYKENTGPGLSRNYGNERSNGNYTLFLDSDCVIPPHYIQTVRAYLSQQFVDAFGGPDKADKSFSTLQKAINYAMTSFLTTGGIRGAGERLEKFHPRSFNMGYSKEVFAKTKGFSSMRFGEDIDMSIRINGGGFKTALIKEAYVYHKRRTTFKQFFKQVHNSGIARINLFKRHPGSLKLVHTFPSLFVVGVLVLLLASIFVSVYCIAPLVLYTLMILVDATITNKNLKVGIMAIWACYTQLIGYGSGFILAFFKRIVFSKGEFSAFKETFYE